MREPERFEGLTNWRLDCCDEGEKLLGRKVLSRVRRKEYRKEGASKQVWRRSDQLTKTVLKNLGVVEYGRRKRIIN